MLLTIFFHGADDLCCHLQYHRSVPMTLFVLTDRTRNGRTGRDMTCKTGQDRTWHDGRARQNRTLQDTTTEQHRRSMTIEKSKNANKNQESTKHWCCKTEHSIRKTTCRSHLVCLPASPVHCRMFFSIFAGTM